MNPSLMQQVWQRHYGELQRNADRPTSLRQRHDGVSAVGMMTL